MPACLPSRRRTAEPSVPPERRIIVTATRTPTPLEEVLAPVLLVDRAEIDRSLALDPSELLRFRAGIDLSRNGGPGQTTGLFIRGGESNHTLVLVDGVRINPGTIGIAQIQNLPPQLLERIEVVKGPRSALYGSDAIGGVVNVITRRGRDGWSAEAGVGAHDTTSASLVGGFGDQALGLDFGVSWLDSAGFPTRSDSDVDRGYDDLGVTARFSGRVGAGELALKHFNASGTTEYVDFLLTPVDQDYRNATTALEYVGALGEAATLRLAAEPDGRPHRAEPVAGLPAHRARHARCATRPRTAWRALAERRRVVLERGRAQRVLRLGAERRHRELERVRAGPHLGRTSRRTARARLLRPRDRRQRDDLEPRVRLRVDAGRAGLCADRHGLPCAGRH